LKRRTPSEDKTPPDLGPVTPGVLELFQRGLAGKKDVQEKIKHYSSKLRPTIRDLLTLAWYRNWLTILQPPLPAGAPPTPASVWKRWFDHDKELKRLGSLGDEIRSYLAGSGEVSADRDHVWRQMHELIACDDLTYSALYPVVKKLLRKKRGRPITRGPIAVRALQLKVDKKWPWMRIANEVCDCSKGSHDGYCRDNIRQSVAALEKLITRCGLEVPSM
jgi:hypothetical protein